MFKIKLLILLLISFFILSCIKNNNHPSDIKYSVSYIAGEYDGLILKNLMTSYLKALENMTEIQIWRYNLIFLIVQIYLLQILIILLIEKNYYKFINNCIG